MPTAVKEAKLRAEAQDAEIFASAVLKINLSPFLQVDISISLRHYDES